MQLVIEVPDDSPLVEQIKSWQDGSSYELSVVQTGIGKFNLSDAVDGVADEAEEPANGLQSNPAIASLKASRMSAA